jgi:hypothetical protein
MRTIRAITDNNPHTFGIELLNMPLDDTDNPAICTINRADFNSLMDLGCSDVWWINKDGNVLCWGGLSKRALVISRLILDAGPSEIVKYADGDNLNLRRSNLRIVKRGKGSKRWTPTMADINDPHAVTWTTMEAGSYRGTVDGKVPLDVPSYHKGPGVKQYSPEDNQNISMMSTGSVLIHSPISAGYRAG